MISQDNFYNSLMEILKLDRFVFIKQNRLQFNIFTIILVLFFIDKLFMAAHLQHGKLEFEIHI